MKKITLHFISFIILVNSMACLAQSPQKEKRRTISAAVTMSRDVLLDKIKGGWAGQTIGCTYGGPTEFRYRGTMIQDYVPITWPDGYIKSWYINSPSLYDDVYMDLTFVEVFERLGLDAPVDSFAYSFANAGYGLWHANQMARYNILNKIAPPASGHWLNNPHADDLDFQIESDFAGLMSPGMINASTKICDSIGHIMNYGDGWYGGVYMASMYSLAFISDDINFVVEEALKTIPQKSSFYKCMNDIITWHKKFPNDWKQCWFECERKWNQDIGCPEGTLAPYNIDAVINSAYVLIGLLYGDGDFSKTIDISTRCGQDSDCNPASAAGILATMLGYSKIPAYWLKNLKEVEDMNFKYTEISLNKVYVLSFKHALQMIERNGGKVNDTQVIIASQKPVPVRYEKCFEGLYPVERRQISTEIKKIKEVSFDGTGIVFNGSVKGKNNEYVAKVEMYIDGELSETVGLPASYKIRRGDILFWKYQLPKGKHVITFKWLNPENDVSINFGDAIVYSDSFVKPLSR